MLGWLSTVFRDNLNIYIEKRTVPIYAGVIVSCRFPSAFIVEAVCNGGKMELKTGRAIITY